MPKTTKRVRTHITKTVEMSFDAEELRLKLGLPANAILFVEVPGGGDWSNTDLDLEADQRPLKVKWTTSTEEETEE